MLTHVAHDTRDDDGILESSCGIRSFAISSHLFLSATYSDNFVEQLHCSSLTTSRVHHCGHLSYHWVLLRTILALLAYIAWWRISLYWKSSVGSWGKVKKVSLALREISLPRSISMRRILIWSFRGRKTYIVLRRWTSRSQFSHPQFNSIFLDLRQPSSFRMIKGRVAI